MWQLTRHPHHNIQEGEFWRSFLKQIQPNCYLRLRLIGSLSHEKATNHIKQLQSSLKSYQILNKPLICQNVTISASWYQLCLYSVHCGLYSIHNYTIHSSNSIQHMFFIPWNLVLITLLYSMFPQFLVTRKDTPLLLEIYLFSLGWRMVDTVPAVQVLHI